MALRALELCAGYGGFSLGLRLCGIETRTVCMVEREAYAAAVLVAQMEAGWLDPAPVWSDLCTFDAGAWRGCVDLVTAGFPCQPFSLAGKQLRERDERHLWPRIADIVDAVRPGLVFLENVQLRAFVEPLRDLRAMGYRVPPALRVSASDVGAPHRRDRWWVLAADPERAELWAEQGRRESRRTRTAVARDDGADREALADADEVRRRERSWGASRRRDEPAHGCDAVADSGRQVPQVGQGSQGERPQPAARGGGWWAAEPDVGRVVDECSGRVDQLRLLGNGVVPLACAVAFRTLLSDALPSA